MQRTLTIALATLSIAWSGAASALDPRNPDWPCQQIVVPSLSVAAFWTGPSIDPIDDSWKEDPAVADLVARLAARRTPIEEAEKAAADFIVGSEAEKKRKATLLFAGLFATLNSERSQVMDGIARFSRRQQGLRDKISMELSALRSQQDAAHQDAAALDKLGNEIAWATRVFDERRTTIGYVCEVPSLIERRLFLLARTIQQQLE